LGAARRVLARSRRFGAEITPIVADAEALPFRSRGIDVAYVHDGLHHLKDPLRGLQEMARVAGRAVAMTEPARASATTLAVKLGISEVEEEAGNRVERLDPGEAVRTLRAAGFDVLGADRYAMYYRHEPGAAVRRLSAPGLYAVATGTFRLANIPLARIGNKLTIRAVKALDPANAPDGVAVIGGLI
jgi:SAM-dependent methyltransferase